MSFIIGLLSFVLVLVCITMIFLVLIQLPKKEAGVGVAFGGAATDALFGAGSGTVLTKATKYTATAFFVLAVIVGTMQSHLKKKSTREFERAVEQQAAQPDTTATAQPTASTAAQPGAATGSEPAPLMSQPTATPAETSAVPAEVPVENN